MNYKGSESQAGTAVTCLHTICTGKKMTEALNSSFGPGPAEPGDFLLPGAELRDCAQHPASPDEGGPAAIRTGSPTFLGAGRLVALGSPGSEPGQATWLLRTNLSHSLRGGQRRDKTPSGSQWGEAAEKTQRRKAQIQPIERARLALLPVRVWLVYQLRTLA